MTLEPGRILDNKYRIVRLIGEGGMGSVHEGENTLIARRVAIKVLHAGAAANEQALTRFEREAQAAGRIGSDHILEVLDLGTLENGDRYMVMEFLDGEPLSERIAKRGRVQPMEIAHLMRQALKGLQAAHDAGIIHRDLKPDNLYILREKAGQADFVKIIDFGISKFSALGSDMNMTRTGAVMGTPYYMSPEQAKGSAHVDPRSDVYAIGVIMYEALTGRVPFDGNTFNELMFKIVLSEPPPLTDAAPDVDPAFASIVNRAMARELEQRYATASDLMQALEQYLAGKGAAVHTPAGGAPAVSAANPQGTGAAWSNTNDELVVPKKSGGPVALIAVAVVLLLGGGGFAAFSMFSGDTDAAASASAPALSAPVVLASTPLAAEAPALPDSAAVTPEPPASASALPTPEPIAEPIAKPKPAPVSRAAAQAKPRPAKPKPAPVSKSKPKSKPGPTDFGY